MPPRIGIKGWSSKPFAERLRLQSGGVRWQVVNFNSPLVLIGLVGLPEPANVWIGYLVPELALMHRSPPAAA